MKNLLHWLLGAALVCAVALVRSGDKAEDLLHRPMAVFSKAFSKSDAIAHTGDEQLPAAPTPLPAVPAEGNATPTPHPVVKVQAEPPAKPAEPLDLAALSHSPNEWPKVVILKEPRSFTAAINGRVIGTVQVPASARVELVALQGDQVQVRFQGATQVIPIKSTDLIERMQASRHTNAN
ncbi:MAG: hypothetical protein PHQ12_13755 [Chthoniobacteraceae bacterium]|nr:hypothetical protein [Chthoniobacteraceae bacterium]